MRIRPDFSPARLWAIVVKEFVQMRRDRLTFGMMIGIPLLQLVLFGYAINSDPKHLPAGVVLADNGPQGRTLMPAVKRGAVRTIRIGGKTRIPLEELVRVTEEGLNPPRRRSRQRSTPAKVRDLNAELAEVRSLKYPR